MQIIYSEHAKTRMKQRGITEMEVQHILRYPNQIIKSFEGTQEAIGEVNDRTIRVKITTIKSYIKIITVM
ncbi:MAG: DUF4258 domain-containing protein [Candidatus Woesearchaeota archaeon]|nr:DUF4258 domain-containing protein [Candidatus Woesearchaeota archaeon]